MSDWDKIQTELSNTVAHSTYEPYLKTLTLYKMSEKGIIVISPTAKIKATIEKRYLNLIEDATFKVLGKKLPLEIVTKISEIGLGSKTSNISDIQNLDTNGELVVIQKYLKDNFDIKYNVITEETIFKKKKDTEWQLLDNRTINTIYIAIKTNKHYKYINKDALTILLNSEYITSFHPIKEYLESNKKNWNGKTNPLGDFCKGVKVKNKNMNFEEYLRKFLFRMLHMVFNSGRFVNEHILILQSPQKYGKTTFLRNLFPPEFDPYINADAKPNFFDKDTQITSSKTLVHICDEFDIAFKTEMGADQMKEFMSSYSTIKRQAYGRTAKLFKRLCSFMGTTNAMQFLFNKEGNRRYIIFSLSERIPFDYYNVDINELWAQVYTQYLKAVGPKYADRTQIDWTEKQQAAIEENVLHYQKELSEAEYIQRYFEVVEESEYNPDNPLHLWKTSLDIKEFLLNLHPKLKFYEGSIGKALTRLGYHKNSSNNSKSIVAPKSYLVMLKEPKHIKRFENE